MHNVVHSGWGARHELNLVSAVQSTHSHFKPGLIRYLVIKGGEQGAGLCKLWVCSSRRVPILEAITGAE